MHKPIKKWRDAGKAKVISGAPSIETKETRRISEHVRGVILLKRDETVIAVSTRNLQSCYAMNDSVIIKTQRFED